MRHIFSYMTQFFSYVHLRHKLTFSLNVTVEVWKFLDLTLYNYHSVCRMKSVLTNLSRQGTFLDAKLLISLYTTTIYYIYVCVPTNIGMDHFHIYIFHIN